jgi:hypothetical protein
MDGKDKIIITRDGLLLLCAMCNYGYFDGFYNKSVYFTEGFRGDRQYLFQALGNIGATATRQIEEDVSVVIVGDKIIDSYKDGLYDDFAGTFQELINRKNSPFRKIMFLTEKDLISRLKRRVEKFNDDNISVLLKKYKKSIDSGQTDLYSFFDMRNNDEIINKELKNSK